MVATAERRAILLLLDEARRQSDLLAEERSRWRTSIYRLEARVAKLERELESPGEGLSPERKAKIAAGQRERWARVKGREPGGRGSQPGSAHEVPLC